MARKLVFAVLPLICLLAAWTWFDYRQSLNASVSSSTSVYIDIAKGDSLQRIAEKLREQQVAVRPFWFKAIAYLNNQAASLKTGEYELTPGLTVPQIITLFAQGKTKQYALTLLEGWTFKQILQGLQGHEKLVHTLSTADDAVVLAKLKIEAVRTEGLFFPDTYYFEKNMTDISILQRAYRKMQQVLQQEWGLREPDLPLQNSYEALILASIVEKETAIAEERPQIAGVFLRRLQQGMLLQTDPTVIYGMGDSYHGDITGNDLKTPTPYNTYIIPGLPPTPIALPGRNALHAVLHPAHDDSLYFVARGDGSHIFSATLEEHQRAVKAFQSTHEHR